MKYAPWVLVIILSATSAWLYNDRRQMSAESRQAIEASALAAKGQIVSDPVHDLSMTVDELIAENVTLKNAIWDAKQASPGSKPARVICASTGAISVEKQPLSVNSCVLSSGDRAEIRVDTLELATEAGNHVLVGVASAWKLAPDIKLIEGKFDHILTKMSDLAIAPSVGWGFGVSAFAGSHGFAPGLAVSAPPLVVFGKELNIGASVGAGTLGVVGSVSATVRP